MPSRRIKKDSDGDQLSSDIPKFLSQKRELVEWREHCVQKQWQNGTTEGAQYHCLTSRDSLHRYFCQLPSSRVGWTIRAFSPGTGLLKRPVGHNTAQELLERVILDPFLIQVFLVRTGESGRLKYWSRKERREEDMDNLVATSREWLKHATPIIRSGRLLAGSDGNILRFQESIDNSTTHGIPRAQAFMHTSIYDAIGSQMYASNRLGVDVEDVESLSPQIANLVAASLQQDRTKETQDSINKIVADLIFEFDKNETSIMRRNFYLRKMIIQYLLRLDNNQYDKVRIYWAMRALQAGMRDRQGKEYGIDTGLEFAQQSKDIELYYWVQSVLGISGGGRKIDIVQYIESLNAEGGDGFEKFCQRIEGYKKREGAPIFKPFFDFYREWEEFSKQEHAQKKSGEAQRIVARQYILIMLSEIKIRYAYRDTISSGEQSSLQTRLDMINEIGDRFVSSFTKISIDFSAEKNTINDALKKQIARYK